MKKLRHRANGSLAVERAARSPARPNCGYKTGLLDLSIRTKPTTALKNSELYQQASIRRQRRSERKKNLTTDHTYSAESFTTETQSHRENQDEKWLAITRLPDYPVTR